VSGRRNQRARREAHAHRAGAGLIRLWPITRQRFGAPAPTRVPVSVDHPRAGSRSGLQRAIVFGKRDAFRKAFRGFDGRQGRGDDRAATSPPGGRTLRIIRKTAGKIQATVDNARAMMSASPSLVALAEVLRDHAAAGHRGRGRPPPIDPRRRRREGSEVAGERFVGPTSEYASCRPSAWSTIRVHGVLPQRRLLTPRPSGVEGSSHPTSALSDSGAEEVVERTSAAWAIARPFLAGSNNASFVSPLALGRGAHGRHRPNPSRST